MGTNFYWKEIPEELKKYKDTVYDEDILKHIGKRSGAGRYCYDCGTTLNKYGSDCVHSTEYDYWYDKCPICGKEIKSNICSFTWTFLLQKEIVLSKINSPRALIVDEYGTEYYTKDFIEATRSKIEYQSACVFS